MNENNNNNNNNNNTKKESQQKKYKHSRRKPAMGVAAAVAAATPSASGPYKYSDDSIRKQKDNNMKPKNRNRGNVNGNGGGVTVDIIKMNPFLVSPTTKPEPIKNNHNVFLTNHRNQTSFQNVNIDERVKINYFIHNSSIQNDRRRGGGGGGGNGNGNGNGNVFKHGITTVDNRSKPDCGVIINTNDTEEFPTLGGSVKQSTNTTTTNKVLNFKDVIMKQTNTNTNESTTTTTSTTSTASFRASDYSKPLPILSRGNIFLGAFYRNTNDDNDNNDDDNDNSNVGETIIKSTLVDSCDSSYDRLYK
jgi:hypothetical protein